VKIAEHLDELRRQGELLAVRADQAGLAAAIPSCPSWQVKDLLRHTGYVHRWAARHITECPREVIDGPSETEILRGGATDPDLLDWFRAGHAALVETLTEADPAVDCATFMAAPSPLAFWARRQAHETAIHRADAERAAATTPDYPPEFAADGIDELITGFGARRKYQPQPQLPPQPQAAPAADEGLLRVVTTDTGDAWSIELRQGRLQPRRETGAEAKVDAANGAGHQDDAGCTVLGPASGLYLYLWNRVSATEAAITATGDPALLASWLAAVKVRWD
jgi:uncharacterized protein (TIGR03083 family)